MILLGGAGREGLRRRALFFYLIPATVVAFRVAVVSEVQFAQPSHTPGSSPRRAPIRFLHRREFSKCRAHHFSQSAVSACFLTSRLRSRPKINHVLRKTDENRRRRIEFRRANVETSSITSGSAGAPLLNMPPYCPSKTRCRRARRARFG